jgi:anti-sigma B factor antagonist
MDLGFDVIDKDRWTVVVVRGEIDVATAPRLREELISLVNEGRLRLVVDLDSVDFIDSTGLGVLVGALKRIRTHDGELVLVCTAPRITKGFEITGLDRVFSIHDSVDAAVG